MPDYNKLAQTTLDLIKKSGRAFVITRSRPSFDDVTGTPTAGTPQAGTFQAIVLPRYKGRTFDSLDDSIKEKLIQGKARTLYAAAVGAPFAPEALDEVTISGEQWVVIGCTELSPAGITMLYTIGVVKK